MAQHVLKCDPESFDAIGSGKKKFSWRFDDRDFAVGDELVLKRFASGRYMKFDDESPANTLRVRVTYILRGLFGMPEHYCVMSLDLIRDPPVSGDEYVRVSGCTCAYRLLSDLNTERVTENCPVHRPLARRTHINAEGQFQSDKYPTTPPGKVPLSVRDPVAQPYLWQYAQEHRSVDAEFSDDLEFALRNAGYVPPEK